MEMRQAAGASKAAPDSAESGLETKTTGAARACLIHSSAEPAEDCGSLWTRFQISWTRRKFATLPKFYPDRGGAIFQFVSTRCRLEALLCPLSHAPSVCSIIRNLIPRTLPNNLRLS